ELLLDLRDAPSGAFAGDDGIDVRGVAAHLVVADLGHAHAAGPRGRVLARASAEDQRVEQGVRAEAVAAVDRDAGHLTGGIEAGDRRGAVDVGLDPAHDVVLAGADLDRLARDVGPGEVAA